MIELQSFRDSQSKINTDPSIKQFSNKIKYEDGANPFMSPVPAIDPKGFMDSDDNYLEEQSSSE